MATVLTYTVSGEFGDPEQVEATSHRDAARRFLLNPRQKWSDHTGTHDGYDGEVITVVGVTQDAYNAARNRSRRVELLKTSIAEKRRANSYTKPIAERRKLLAQAEQALADLGSEPEVTTETFRVFREVIHTLEAL